MYVGHVPDQLGPIAVVLRKTLSSVVVVLQRASRVSLESDVVAGCHLSPGRSHQMHRDEVERPHSDLAEVVTIQGRDCGVKSPVLEPVSGVVAVVEWCEPAPPEPVMPVAGVVRARPRYPPMPVALVAGGVLHPPMTIVVGV